MMGFGIPVLRDMVKNLVIMGSSVDEAVAQITRDYELRSEAVTALRAALPSRINANKCISCGAPASVYRPFCYDCASFYVDAVYPIAFCALCDEGFPVVNGLHKNNRGGHIGPCTAVQPEAE